MNSPITGKPMKLVKEPRVKLTFRKEEFEITYHSFMCEDSSEKFTSDEEDRINQAQVYNQYREKYGIPFPDEIREIREMYDVSASKMSDILGFGTNTYRLYESGEIPSVANGRLILAIKQPADFIKQVEASSNLISAKDKEHLSSHVRKLIEKQQEQTLDLYQLKQVFIHEKPDQYSGYCKPNLIKLAHVIAFFNQHMSLFKTKLNKLLFYADFGCFSKTAFSITGVTYRAIPLGPVPANYDILFSKLQQENLISLNQELINDTGNYGDLISSCIAFDSSLFAPEELYVLETIALKFKDFYAKQMVEISHQEPAWEMNKDDKSLISYQKFAFGLVNF
ncbi:MAG: type II toxin-antitoxin system antitoxin SocA domain-containing protein [Bacteroidota bacterium]